MRGNQLLTSWRTTRRQSVSTTAARAIRVTNIVLLVLLVVLVTLWVKVHFAPYTLTTYVFGGAISIWGLWELIVPLTRWGIVESGANVRVWLRSRWLLATLAVLLGTATGIFCMTRSIWLESPAGDRVLVTLYDDTSTAHRLARYTLDRSTPRHGRAFLSTRRRYTVTIEATKGSAIARTIVPLSLATSRTIATTTLRFIDPPALCVMPGVALWDRLPRDQERTVTFELELRTPTTSLVHVMRHEITCIGKAAPARDVSAARHVLLAHLATTGVPPDAQAPYLRLLDAPAAHVQANLVGGSTATLRVTMRDSSGRGTSVLTAQVRLPQSGTSYVAL
jgi:hypothetical protein